MQLYEKYRPKTLEEFVGQDKIKKQIEFLMARPHGDRDSLWFEGDSGLGKTSLAWAIARVVVETDWAVFEYNGNYCNKGRLKDIHYSIGLSAPKGRWKVYIINESHAMSRPSVQSWLTLLEQLPKHRLVIFTTTESLGNNLFGNFSEPFARRCKVFRFTNDEELTRLLPREQKRLPRPSLWTANHWRHTYNWCRTAATTWERFCSG